MGRRSFRKQPLPFLEKVEVIDAGAEGKAVARVNNRVVFIPFGVPGDIVDVQVTKKKKSFFEARIVHFHEYSPFRIEPVCEHFGLCGGCRWQNMSYDKQLFFKQKQVKDHFDRIGKFDYPEIRPILASEDVFFYRNKLDYTFSSRKWFTGQKPETGENTDCNGIGFHLIGMFDRIIDIEKCHLQPDPSNEIRLAVREYSLSKGLSFYNAKTWEGLLRNLIIRNTLSGQLMVIIVFRDDEEEIIRELLQHVKETIPAITSLMYVINPKKNDDISDLEIRLFHGNPYILEELTAFHADDPQLKFKIGPVSFFQTNAKQAALLYHVAAEMAGFQGHETVYDLYSGAGAIACYVSKYVRKVVGLESIPSAVADAGENAVLNGITNVTFHAGDIAKILNQEFFEANGLPDIIITDPPRNGMHGKVIDQILAAMPQKVVYISCNPATQARDIRLMSDLYEIKAVQPADMFPHTQHVENVVLLERVKSEE
ncbi:MAG: 23S rRNA (uracil(1939)-C(5))-methyltransferase RlmD [Bacteroidales bacterium]|nr:23S rRNA (uracil(1939)-C(5))-methyltransferase RlmD [Bacteroidales bacterium]